MRFLLFINILIVWIIKDYGAVFDSCCILRLMIDFCYDFRLIFDTLDLN